MRVDGVGEVDRGQLMPSLIDHVKKFAFYSNGHERRK